MKQSHRTACWLTCVACMVAAAGCKDNHGLVPVSGTVMIDGKPLTTGQVMVSPEGHRQSIGPLDDQGRFTLTCYEKGDGAPIGAFPVAVMAVEQISERELRWHAPRSYASEKRSGLTVNIQGPTNDLNIELTWKGSKHSKPYVEKF